MTRENAEARGRRYLTEARLTVTPRHGRRGRRHLPRLGRDARGALPPGRLVLHLPGARWDLDHADDRAGYNGPACRRCNRAAGARKGNRLRALRRRMVVRLPSSGSF